MADYSIFVLGESELSVSGGGQLDGVTQGNGSHLVGRTITLNSNNWQEIFVTDDETNFGDSDSSQSLNGAQSVDGVVYASGTMVESEFALTLSDGSQTYQVVAFNVTNSAPAYGTVEGLAFIGDPGGFPPIGVPLSVLSATEGPNDPVEDFATPICFAAGTRIATPDGPRDVATIGPGDLVSTLDRGAQPVVWASGRRMAGQGAAAPVRLPAGAFGNRRALVLSPNHRVLLRGPRCQLLFGCERVLVAAKHLSGLRGVASAPCARIDYHHLLLADHALIWAEGCACETLHPGEVALGALGAGAAAEVRALIDAGRVAGDGPAAARVLRGYEANVLRAALRAGKATTGGLAAAL